MKKAIAGFFMLACCVAVSAQDVKTVKKHYDGKELDKAKQAVDAAVAKDGNKAENWYWKHKVYYAISTSEQYKNLAPDAAWQGFEAIKKYADMDKNMEVMIKDGLIGFTQPFEAYYANFRLEGGKQLDAKNYDESFKQLRNALAVSTYFYEQKWFPSPLDTSITFYAGYAAMNAKKNDETELYFKKLSDADAAGTDVQIAYGWLANYYLNEKNESEKAKAIIEKGLKHYPNDDYLKSMKLQLAQKNHDWVQILKEHETIMAGANPEFSDYLSYGADLFDYMYEDTIRKPDFAEKAAKFESIMTTALGKKPGSSEANFLVGMHHSQRVIDMEKEVKNTFKGVLKPDEVTKKKAMQAQIAGEAEKAIKYLDMASTLYGSRLDKLKEEDKERYKQSLNNLIYFNDKYKKDAERVKVLEEKLKAIKG